MNNIKQHSPKQLSELQILGVSGDVSRFKREITPGQEGLLDWCSHVDASPLLGALQWITQQVEASVSGGATPEVHAHLQRIWPLMESLQEIIDEGQ